MKKQAFNPYLPSYEYVPDGEPRVFGNRVYVYGSHDRFNGSGFCLNDYVCWSAPVDDLGDWRFEGTIYKRTQDPKNKKGKRPLYAPDCVQGPDGRYYLYYALDQIGVAVSDNPAGPFEFLGYVRHADGAPVSSKSGDPFVFDPGVFVDDDGRVFLYYGFAPRIPWVQAIFKILGVVMLRKIRLGGYVVELAADMQTTKSDMKMLFNPVGLLPGGGNEGHEFLEASSMRKIDGVYHFIYSSNNGHELCYATSDSPMGPFRYRGTLVSNGDLYINGKEKDEDAYNYTGNTHGSLVQIQERWFVFYHRQTNRHQFSRQAMAEEITRLEDGSFKQAELTSCGLNGGPLRGQGEYEARIACHLMSAQGPGRYPIGKPNGKFEAHPYFTQSGADREDNPDQYIANMKDGAVAGFRYFELRGLSEISVSVRASAAGFLEVATTLGGEPLGTIPILPNADFTRFQAPVQVPDGKQALYFTYRGNGYLDFRSFELL